MIDYNPEEEYFDAEYEYWEANYCPDFESFLDLIDMDREEWEKYLKEEEIEDEEEFIEQMKYGMFTKWFDTTNSKEDWKEKWG